MKKSLLLLFLLLPFTGISQPSSVKLDKYFQRKMNRADLIGLQVAYLSDGEFIWQGDYGVKEMNTTDSVNSETLFMIASCSKPVTALGILKLVDQGKLNLDEPVNNYLPFAVINPHYPDDPITIRMLLSHVSSIRDNWDVLVPLYTVETGGGDSPLELSDFVNAYLTPDGRFYDKDKSFAKEHPPSSFAYSNVGYALSGLLIESVTGQSFPDFMRKEILGPLGMDQSYWMLKNIPHKNIARPHDIPNDNNQLSSPKVLPHYGYPDYPDGQLRMPASDYARFLKVIVNRGRVNGNQFINPALMDEFIRIQYPEIARHQALAWNYNEFDNFVYYLLMPRLPSHTGADPGVATAVSFDPETGNAGIIFTNSPPVSFIQQKVFYQEMMKKLFKAAKKEARKK